MSAEQYGLLSQQLLKPSPGELPAISPGKDKKELPHAFLQFVVCLISALLGPCHPPFPQSRLSHAPRRGCGYEDQPLVRSRLIGQPCFSEQPEVLFFTTSESPDSLPADSILPGLLLQVLCGLPLCLGPGSPERPAALGRSSLPATRSAPGRTVTKALAWCCHRLLLRPPRLSKALISGPEHCRAGALLTGEYF